MILQKEGLGLFNEITKEQAEEIYKDYSTYVFQTALFLTKSRTLADDITQETFIQIFRKYNTFDLTKPLKPWIYKITLNITRNMLRKHKWLHFLGDMPDVVALNNVEDTVIKSEGEREILTEINKLPQKSKEIIVLHYYAELKLNEIVEVLNIPLGTCKSRLNTALTILRRNLPEEFKRGGDNLESV
jgi:RNA polymerase sigma-70 factor, ECF subfamily